jgi:hypothetical protein
MINLHRLRWLSAGVWLTTGAFAFAGPLIDDPELFTYTPLSLDHPVTLTVGADSPHFVFRSGDSPVAAFRLPETTGHYLLDVIAPMDPPQNPSRSQVFYPALAMLSAGFTVLRVSDSSAWHAELPEFGLTDEPGYRVTVDIDGNGPERYLIVFTPRDEDTRSLPGAADHGRLQLRLSPVSGN